MSKRLWNLSQELRELSIEEEKPIAFLIGSCGCGDVLGIFNPETQKLLLNVFERDKRNSEEIWNELVVKLQEVEV